MKLTYIDFDNFIIVNKNKSKTVPSYSFAKICKHLSSESQVTILDMTSKFVTIFTSLCQMGQLDFNMINK